VRRYVSPPLEVAETDGRLAPFERADLIFYEVDHSVRSYEARVFLNNEEAGFDTPPEPGEGYAGSFNVFGHGACVGEEGHCDPTDREVDDFDYRAPHPIEPWTLTVTITDALKQADQAEVTVTVVAVASGPEGAEETDALAFDRVRLATYLGDDELEEER
jgi:hypothetical protein